MAVKIINSEEFGLFLKNNLNKNNVTCNIIVEESTVKRGVEQLIRTSLPFDAITHINSMLSVRFVVNIHQIEHKYDGISIRIDFRNDEKKMFGWMYVNKETLTITEWYSEFRIDKDFFAKLFSLFDRLPQYC